jgi:hypothetical protein
MNYGTYFIGCSGCELVHVCKLIKYSLQSISPHNGQTLGAYFTGNLKQKMPSKQLSPLLSEVLL